MAEGLSRIYIINFRPFLLKLTKSVEWWLPANTRAKVRVSPQASGGTGRRR